MMNVFLIILLCNISNNKEFKGSMVQFGCLRLNYTLDKIHYLKS